MSKDSNILDLFRLDDHVAIITGGSRGLGEVMAEGLAQVGATTVICSRHQDTCDATAARITESTGRSSMGIALDVTDADNVQRVFDLVMEKFGRLDVLINSAGINARHLAEDCPVETYKRVIDINLTGSWLTCRSAARVMKPRKSGSIINMGSALSTVALPQRTPYCSSKFGVIGLTQSLALECAESRVRVNAICPGPFLTEMNQPVAADPKKTEQVVGQTALRRWGELPEIVGAAVYLASPASSYVTGSSLYVDAGWTAQ